MLSYPFDAFGQPLAQVLRETPHPVGSEVVVRVGSCGLCHSDVHSMPVTFVGIRDDPLNWIWSDTKTVHREAKESDAAFEARARAILGAGIIFGD
jgi:hypothetical protein